MFERDQTEKWYLIIQIKAKGRYLLIKISTQNRQTHFMASFKSHPHSLSTAACPPKEEQHSLCRLRGSGHETLLFNITGQQSRCLLHWCKSLLWVTMRHRVKQGGPRCYHPPTAQHPEGLVPDSQPATARAGARTSEPDGTSPGTPLCRWPETRLLPTAQAAWTPPQVRQQHRLQAFGGCSDEHGINSSRQIYILSSSETAQIVFRLEEMERIKTQAIDLCLLRLISSRSAAAPPQRQGPESHRRSWRWEPGGGGGRRGSSFFTVRKGPKLDVNAGKQTCLPCPVHFPAPKQLALSTDSKERPDW